MKIRAIDLICLITLSLFSVSLHAELKTGQPFPAITLEDQFGHQHSISKTDRLVLISFDRDVSDAVHEYLNQQPKAFLRQNNTRYISDISAMPGIITRMFALPKMRDYNYSVMLNNDEDFKSRFNAREKKLTVYKLNAGMIQSIEFIDGNAVSHLLNEQMFDK